ncbi:Asp23/Gls24 family envelope stress response protein [Streptomyces sp. NPDC016309]|uniref:Asp23/Gls24 family envelope stress response protein n=1 Tax=Streptomyces sp. NPDC016309 TaxID=3364965 RepID=UPI0036F8FC93
MTVTTGGGDAVTGALAAERGSVTIADRVVAKIAARAAREALAGAAEDEGGGGRGGLPGTGGGRPPHATVVVHRDTARVRISLELGYPSDIGARCGAVRRHVTRRVETLAGLAVPEVAVQVERLHSSYTRDHDKGRGRVR